MTTNRLAVVTGGTRGIGAAISTALQNQGHNVVALYGGNHDAAKSFREATGINVVACDVADPSDTNRTFAQIVQDHGGVDILVNNAGVTRDRMLHRMSPEEWNTVIDTNLNALYHVTSQVIGGMRDRKFGRIVVLSSVNARQGSMGQTNYAATKAAAIGFTKSLALENAIHGVTVNAVAPGYIATDMVRAIPEKVLEGIVATVPVKRLGTPEEIARAVLFLTDENAGYITGATIDVNGGLYLA